MIIRFTSTMTADDEVRAATALTQALKCLLAPFPIAYAIRIETTAGDVIVDSCTDTAAEWWAADDHAAAAGERRIAAGSSL